MLCERLAFTVPLPGLVLGVDLDEQAADAVLYWQRIAYCEAKARHDIQVGEAMREQAKARMAGMRRR